MNEKLDEICRAQYTMEKDINKGKVLKGTRYLLLRNGAEIFDEQYRARLDNALPDMNKPISQAYTTSKSKSERYGCSPINKQPKRSCSIEGNRRRRAKGRS